MSATSQSILSDGETPRDNDIVIAIMGMTGSGKSSLISLCIDQEIEIGHDLESCTQDVKTYIFHHPKLRSGRIYLVDTPGFDDTNRKDAEILRILATWLTSTYAGGVKLSGIIYCHRINQTRMQGSALKNIRAFRSLCGDDALSKVVLVTTMWDIESSDIAARREKELKETPKYWGDMITKGSQVLRHDNTQKSAFALIETFIKDDSKIVLGIQKEMVNDQKSLDKTEAGRNVESMLEEQNASLRNEIKNLEAELRAAMKAKDEEIAEVMTKLRLESKEALQQVLDSQQQLQATMQQLQESKAAELQAKLEEGRQKLRSQVPPEIPVVPCDSTMRAEKESQPSNTLSAYPPPKIHVRNRVRRAFPAHLTYPVSVLVSPDGSYLVFHNYTQGVLVATDTGKELERHKTPTFWPNSVAVSPDGRILTLIYQKKIYKATTRLSHPRGFQRWDPLEGHEILAISKDFETVVSFQKGAPEYVGLTSLNTKKWHPLELPTALSTMDIKYCSFAKHDKLLICMGIDHLYFFSTENGRLLRTERIPSTHNMYCLSGDTLVYGFVSRSEADGLLRKAVASFFDLSGKLPELVSTFEVSPTMQFFDSASISLSFNGSYFVRVLNGTISFFHVMSGKRIQHFQDPFFHDVSFFPHDNRLVWTTNEGYYEIMEVVEE
ncbi:hypothetical protein F5Y01DRAFT_288033 [Xylaria sp. FL0043]|nr:hypothetical protein F5Y01DRAFT_288033 [Xylaria sp. FL0043]